MSMTENEKNALISEIEENLSNTIALKPKSLQEDVIQLYADRDSIVSQDAIHLASTHGVDPRLMTDVVHTTEKVYEGSETEELSLDDQFDFFVSNFETVDLIDLLCNTADDDGSGDALSAKDRLLNLKLPRDAFNPLLDQTKHNNVSLWRTLGTLPIVSGQSKSKKSNKKEKRKDRKDRTVTPVDNTSVSKGSHSKGRNAYRAAGKRGDIGISNDNQSVESEDVLSNPKRFRELLALVVAKNVAENTMSSYLATISLLIAASRSNKYASEFALDSDGNRIAVGSTVATLFEKTIDEDDDEDDEPLQDSENEMEEDEGDEDMLMMSHSDHDESYPVGGSRKRDKYSLNPFRNYLVASHHARSKSMTNSEMSRYDEEQSVSVCNDEQNADDSRDDIQSAEGEEEGVFQGRLVAPSSSVDGGSTVATLGTDGNSSMQLADDEDDDISEEELLAQALALSMGAEHMLPSSGNNSNNTSTQQLRGHGATDQSISSTLPSYSVQLSEGEREAHDSLFSESLSAAQFEKHSQEAVPGDLPLADSLSTFGPFCCADFWARVAPSIGGDSSSVDVNSVLNNSVSVRHALFALLVVISNSVDEVLQTKPSSPSPSTQSGGQKSSTVSDGAKSPRPYVRVVGTTLSVSPNPVTTFLIEHLLEVLTQELAVHATRVNATLGSHQMGGHEKLSSDLTMRVSSDGGRAQSPSSMDLGGEFTLHDPTEHSSANQRDLAESGWHFHQYFLTFALNTVLRLFQATMQEVVTNRFSMNAIGLGGGSGAESTGSASPTSSNGVLGKLLTHLVDCMGPEGGMVTTPSHVFSVPSGSINRGGSLFEALTVCTAEDKCPVDMLSTFSVNILSTPNDPRGEASSDIVKQVALCYSQISFIHELRKTAINAYVSALTAYHSTVQKRYLFLERLLKTAPLLTSSTVGHCCEDSSLLQLLNIEQYDRNFDVFLRSAHEAHKLPAASYYQLYLLQKVCLAVLQSDDSAAGLKVIPNFPIVPATNGSSSSSTGAYQHLSQKTKTDSETRDDALITTLLPDLQSLLVGRLKDPLLLQGTHKHRVYSAGQCLFWGELAILRSLQTRLVAAYLGVVSASPRDSQPQFDFLFNPKRCHPNLNVSEDARVVQHNGPKLWATCSSSVGFEPNSGVYEWLLRVDRCTKGHAFVGIVTADCSLEKDSYVGVDRYGYGCIGTKGLWHNKTKVVTEYGTGFASGSVVCCRVDTDKSTLSLGLVDVATNTVTEWGQAFDSLPKSRLFPAFSLHEKDDQITLLYCGRVPSVVVASTAPPAVRVSSNSLSLQGIDGGSSPMRGGSPTPSGASTNLVARTQVTLTESEYQVEKHFVLYVQQLYTTVSALLDAADRHLSGSAVNSSRDDAEVILSHPAIGVLLASLAASLSSRQHRVSTALHMSTLHVLPLLTVLTKRLSGLFDALNSSSTSVAAKKKNDMARVISSAKQKSEFSYRMNGSWTMSSSAIISVNIASQRYTLHFEDPETVHGIDEDGVESGQATVQRLSGSASSDASSMVGTFQGTLFGTRVKILESWVHPALPNSVQSHSLTEGRLSLCGQHFSGRYRDTKTNKMGSITGTRITAGCEEEFVKSDGVYLRGTLNKTVLLCTTAVSKLSSHVLISNCSVVEPIPTVSNVTPAAESGSSPVDPSDDVVMTTESDVIGSSSSEVAETEDDDETLEGGESDRVLALHCVKSSLLSGGFSRSNPLLAAHLLESVYSYLRPTVVTGVGATETFTRHSLLTHVDSSSNELIWWLSSVFPELRESLTERLRDDFSGSSGRQSPVEVLVGEEISMPSSPPASVEQEAESAFYRELVSGKVTSGENVSSKLLDDSISLHAGQSALVKIGGEVMQHARRVVLAVMIKHTGCYQLCVNEYQSITSVSGGYRPNPVLLDVWRAVQRVIERTVRFKQESGATYSAVCRSLCNKAELLLEVEPNRPCCGVTDSLAFVLVEHQTSIDAVNSSGGDWWTVADTAHNISQEVSKCIAHVIEFLINPLRSANSVREIMFQHAFNAILRSAGMKAMLLLLNKTSANLSAGSDGRSVQLSLPAVTSLSLQSIPIGHMMQSLRDIHTNMRVPSTKHNDVLLSHASSTLTAHFSDGLSGVGEALLQSCRSAFEAMYEFITNYLSRCSWSGASYRDGQIVALAAWNLVVRPEDHSFLNKVAIFRVLQTVLEDARSSMSALYGRFPHDAYFQKTLSEGGTSLEVDFLTKFKDFPSGIFACDFLLNSHKRLAQFVLSVVHGLAIQVASVRDARGATAAPSTRAPRLQRIQSGPDTLSKSLFDLMYVELFTTTRSLVIASDKAAAEATLSATTAAKAALSTVTPRKPGSSGASPTPSANSSSKGDAPSRSVSSSLGMRAMLAGGGSVPPSRRATDSPSLSPPAAVSDGGQEEYLEGELYVYRILRLLFLVSSSKVCQKLLCSPKWISLLLNGIGYGGLSIQRRIMTLLRRLLMNTDPSDISAVIPALFAPREDLLCAETPLDDDEVRLLISSNADEGETRTSAQNLVRFFLEGVSAIYVRPSVNKDSGVSSFGGPSDLDALHARKMEFVTMAGEKGVLDALSADSLVILRVLYGVPAWRVIIAAEISQSIATTVSHLSSVDAVDVANQLSALASSLAVVGGYIERLRVGGLVSMKPFCLLGPSSDVYATKIAAASYSSAMLISMSAASASVEVVLMERGLKITSGGGKIKGAPSRSEPMIQHTTMLASSVPVKTVRLNTTDVLPAADVAVISSLIHGEIVAQLVRAVNSLAIPWMKTQPVFVPKDLPHLDMLTSFLSSPKAASATADEVESTASKASQHVTALRVLTSVYSIKSLSMALQNETNVDALLRKHGGVFKELLTLAVGSTESGNLDGLEGLEERFSKLWISYCKSDAPSPVTAAPVAKLDSQSLRAEDAAATQSGISRLLAREGNRASRQERAEQEAIIAQTLALERGAAGTAGVSSLRDLASLLSPFGASARLVAATVDPATKAAALAQCMEMGLPQDFCEFALRRCHYNVEMAINMCLENGDQMSMMIEQEAQHSAAQAAREAAGATNAASSVGRRSQFLRTSGASEAALDSTSSAAAVDARIQRLEQRIAAATAASGPGGLGGMGSSILSSAQGLRQMRMDNVAAAAADLQQQQQQRDAFGARSRSIFASGGSSLDPQAALARQLVGMGFPPQWCARALANSGATDLDSALGYIMSHDAELSAADNQDAADRPPTSRQRMRVEAKSSSRREEEEDSQSAMDLDIDPSELLSPNEDYDLTSQSLIETDADRAVEPFPLFTPIVEVSGHAEIQRNLTCTITGSGFPSVGCRNYPVNKGKWYFELTVLTAGCVQVGWVDTLYEGGADAGQGVGDDPHSWAFDGWRSYIWHETSAEWGTKWASGDTVGCALDCDNKTMSFFLNGFGEDVGMGEAFREARFHGGLYPCASFNRNERVKFSFGGSLNPFKHTPPVGYRPYCENILAVRESNKAIMRALSSNGTSIDTAESEFLNTEGEVVDRAALEDCFEGGVGDRASPWFRRYFSQDDTAPNGVPSSRALNSETFNYFGTGGTAASYMPRIPLNKRECVEQMTAVGKDLCVLYSRMSVLRTLSKLSGSQDVVAQARLLLSDEVGASETDLQQVVSSLFSLLRISSSHTARTRAYLSGITMFPSTHPTPSNFGSIFSTGGYPVLLQLRDTFTALLKGSRTGRGADAAVSSALVEGLLGEVFAATKGAVNRDIASLWRSDDNFVPVITSGGMDERGGLLSLHDYETMGAVAPSQPPSLALAVWATSILMEQFIRELGLVNSTINAVTSSDNLSATTANSSDSFISTDAHQLNTWIHQLLNVWMFALRSPAVSVKLCAMRVVSYVLQEFMASSDVRVVSLLNEMVSDLFIQNKTLLARYEAYATYKLNAERSTWPVCSEYLQALLEFTVTLKNIFHLHTLQSVSTGGNEEDGVCIMRLDSGDAVDDSSLASSVMSTISMKIDSPTALDDDLVLLTASDSTHSALSELECEFGNADFNWEAVSGRVFSDVSEHCTAPDSDSSHVTHESSGWITFSGSVRVLKTYDWPVPLKRSVATAERQDLPPELMPGCKVLRQVSRHPRMSGIKRPRGESGASEHAPDSTSSSPSLSTNTTGLLVGEEPPSNISVSEDARTRTVSHDEPASTALFRLGREVASTYSPMDRIKRIFTAGDKAGSPLSGEKTSAPTGGSVSDGSEPTEDDEMLDQIGTVTAICAWPNDLPGTAREVLWDDGEKETIRWGAQSGVFDVTHVAVRGGKVVVRHPTPLTYITKLASSGFGSEQTYGVLFRMRHVPKKHSDTNEDVKARVVCAIEYPDFSACVLATGSYYHDGTYVLTEQKLISGCHHSGWEGRFGTAHYQTGTSYNLTVSHSSGDVTDPTQCSLQGEYQFKAVFPIASYDLLGDVKLQRKHLFVFDDKTKASNMSCSVDKLSVAKVAGGSQGVAFGSVGFSSGVHYWEFKVEQADVGSIFIGVSEKPTDIRSARLTRWMGAGFASNRASFKTSASALGERVQVYGDHFHTGDLVGVMLDMNRGKLSFFLDGLKYGEHTLADLGTAFDNLCGSGVKPPTYYPIVGLSKSNDRVTLTSRWLSNIGTSTSEEYRMYNKAWLLLSSWSVERPMNKPFSEHLWIYREGWRNWLAWKSGKYVRIRTRCTVAPIPVVIDVTPRACVVASLKLGLSVSLFSGDHVQFSKSSGKSLDTKEEAIILGVYHGALWYRLDAQKHNGGALMESNALSWSLQPNDVEGMTLVRRRLHTGVEAVTDIPLARIPAFQGGLIHLFHESGAIVRDGLEIDTSDVMCTIPSDATVYSTERRMNASNIERYRVLHEGKYGWISERMRGGAEEVMLTRVTSASDEEKAAALAKLLEEVEAVGIKDRIVYKHASSLADAVSAWEESVRGLGLGALLEEGGALSSSPGLVSGELTTFEHFLTLSCTMDGARQWSVEADMQLVELIAKRAAKEGVTPHNLSAQSLATAIVAESSSTDKRISCLIGIDVERAVARSAILRVANLIFGHALPYINMMLPEEKLKFDVVGSDCDIAIIPTVIPPVDPVAAAGSPVLDTTAAQPQKTLSIADALKFKDYGSLDETDKTRNPLGEWTPLCCARRMRSLRRLLFSQTKQLFFDSILEVTSTATPLHQDEYEDPREIKNLRLNRVKATASKLSTLSVGSERLKQSVFGQLHKELRQWPSSAYRRSYVGKGHGNQKRAFKVKFIGEGVNDYGGPYRAVFEQVIDELQCGGVVAGGKKPSEQCLLPLLMPCPNRFASVGNNQDKFVLTTATNFQPINQELMQFLGKIVGTAVRHNLNLALDLSSMFWRPLARVPVTRAHLQSVDALVVTNLSEVTKLGLKLEEQGGLDGSYQPEDWTDLTFSAYLPDGSRVALLPGGHDIPVNISNWRDYVSLTELLRLRESVSTYKVLREGLSAVLPVELFPLFTASELQRLISGTSEVDVALLKQCTEYEDLDPHCDLVGRFWEVLEEMSAEEKTLFLRFVWARSRMPGSAQELPMNFKLQGQQAKPQGESSDDYLPHAQTCFFSLSLPPYSSKEVLRAKLLYAINNSPNMDADVRLHSAEGWADS